MDVTLDILKLKCDTAVVESLLVLILATLKNDLRVCNTEEEIRKCYAEAMRRAALYKKDLGKNIKKLKLLGATLDYPKWVLDLDL
jgi:hypothetical protein